jgi:hypothetical protein
MPALAYWRRLLECRPLILVGVAFEGRTDLWVMERGAERENADDGVLYAAVSHLQRGNGETVDLGRPQRETKLQQLTSIAGDVSCLMKEITGEFIED